MTIRAELANGDVLEFPDDTPGAVVDMAVRRHMGGGSSTAADVAKSAAFAIPKAVAGIAGFPADALGLINRGVEWALSKQHGGKPSDYRQPSLIADNLGSQEIRGAAEGLTGPWHDPQTRAGKVADTLTQTAATFGRGLLSAPSKSLPIIGATTAGIEGAGAMTNDNPLARFMGGLLGLPLALSSAAKSRSGVVIRDALGDLSPEQIGAGRAMQETARARGLPLMGNESLDSGHQLASAVYASQAGNKIIEPFLKARPGQVARSVNRDIIDQTGARGTPGDNAARAQQAATDVISDAERARTRAAQPYYQAAEYESIPPQSLRSVANEIEGQIYRQPINSPVDRQLGNAYGQLFREVEAPAQSSGRILGRQHVPPQVDPHADDIVMAVRKLGGINPDDGMVGAGLARDLDFTPDPRGAVWRRPVYGGSKGRSNTTAGHSSDEITRKLYEHGYINDPSDFNGVLSKLEDHALGVKTHFSTFYEPPNTDPLANAIERLTEQLAVKNAPRQARAQTITTVEPETNVGRLNKLYQNLRHEAELPSIGATSAEKSAAVPISRVSDELREVLRRENPNIRRGQDVYSQYTREHIEPLTAGPVGVVAGKTGADPAAPSPVPRVVGAIADTNTVRPETIRELYRSLNIKDRKAFPGIAQTHFENQLNAALGDVRTGPNPTGGAKFRQAIAGTDQDRANFQEIMRGVAAARGKNPDTVLRGANTLLDVLERTGRTPGIGSQTAPRSEISANLGRTKTGDALAAISAAPLGPLQRRIDDWVLRNRYEDLARALTDPDSVGKLVALGKYKPSSDAAAYMVVQILGLGRAIASDQTDR